MLAEGQKTGSPDIDIEVAKGKYFGMKLEVKTESNKAKIKLNCIMMLDFTL